jgi:hypothetical protein
VGTFTGHQRGPLPGHQWGLSHGHGHAQIVDAVGLYWVLRSVSDHPY